MFEREVEQADEGNLQKMPGSSDPHVIPGHGTTEQVVPNRLYQLIGEVLSFTAQVDQTVGPASDVKSQ